MRAAVIFGLGTSPKDLDRFQAGSGTQWVEGVPASSADAEAVLIFGGDGTIHRHLPALVRLQLPVLVVPAGSGNDFARALKLRSARDSLRAWREFESGKAPPRNIDLGVITPAAEPERAHYFCCVAGFGLDSAVARLANQMPRWLRAHGGYALGLLPVLFQLPAFSLRLTRLDSEVGEGEGGEAREKVRETEDDDARGKLTLLAAFANTQFYGDGMRIAPQADPCDGKLDICRIHTMSPFKLFCMFPTVYFGHHLRVSEVKYSQAGRVRVETKPPLEIYADGEFVCQTPVEITVAAGALRVIAPA
jgi:diacylglycerol kinase (ATP)